MDSKWNAGEALSQVIQLRGYAKANITVTPYADIYPTVKYASYVVQERGQHGQPTTLVCPLSSVNDTEIYIYSAPQLASVGDLSGLKVGFADFSMATRLQAIKIGDNASGYDNPNLTALTLGNNVLLQTLDVRKCSGLGTGDQKTVDLSGCEIIEEVYFDGTAIQGVALPNGGVLRVLHLPLTITNLTIMNQKNITDLTVGSYSNISTLRLENVPTVDSEAILRAVPTNTRVRLIGFTWECSTAAEIDGLMDILDTMRGLDESGNNMETAQVSGTIHIASLTGDQIAEFNERYPYITIDADHTESHLYYYNFDGTELLYDETIYDGGDGAYTGTPSKSSDAQYVYTFAGWSTRKEQVNGGDPNATKGIVANRNVYAAYTTVVQKYTVTWKNADGTTLETDSNVPYGSTPTYNGAIPTYQGQTASGWTPDIGPVTGNITYTAKYIPTYTVRFLDDDGVTVLETKTVQEGNSATYTGVTPTSPYGTFLEWNPNPVNVRNNTDCVAVYDITMVEPDLKYLVYTLDDTNMTITITGLNEASIVADNLKYLTIPDTINGYCVKFD